MIELDGSFGEGGGQVLRTALGLSCLLNKSFHIFNIRKKRKKPGLMPQHLMGIRASKLISGANVSGDSEGSQELFFEPVEVKSGDYFFDIGTAGSTSLLLQAILPPLVFAKGRSFITLKGGTHVPFSPPFHYISEVFIPTLEKIGIMLETRIENYGFYPRGGGKISVDVNPSGGVIGINFLERGGIKRIKGTSGVGNLPLHIAERQRDAALRILATEELFAEIETLSVPASGHGTFIFLKIEADDCIAGFSSLGERGKRAELVGEEAARNFLNYYLSSACLDQHMADQIVLYLAVAEGESSFTTSQITSHLLTNLWAIGKFTDIKYEMKGDVGSQGMVTIRKHDSSSMSRN
ncbi:MAG: RNA 3'-terminal phosphate cyclase [Nitrospirota bacterium]